MQSVKVINHAIEIVQPKTESAGGSVRIELDDDVSAALALFDKIRYARAGSMGDNRGYANLFAIITTPAGKDPLAPDRDLQVILAQHNWDDE